MLLGAILALIALGGLWIFHKSLLNWVEASGEAQVLGAEVNNLLNELNRKITLDKISNEINDEISSYGSYSELRTRLLKRLHQSRKNRINR